MSTSALDHTTVHHLGGPGRVAHDHGHEVISFVIDKVPHVATGLFANGHYAGYVVIATMLCAALITYVVQFRRSN